MGAWRFVPIFAKVRPSGPGVTFVVQRRRCQTAIYPVQRSWRGMGWCQRGVMLQRSIMIAALMLLATPAAAEWTLPCLFGGCSITLVSPEYAAKPVQPLDP